MALDLRTDMPRSPFDQIDGYAWLPRLIDKTRAYFAGSNGAYTRYPSPGDKHFLAYFQLDAEALGEVIRRGADDAAIVAWVREHSPRSDAEKDTFARELLDPPAKLIERLILALMKRRLRNKFQVTYPGKNFRQINSWSKMLALEDGYPVPGL